MKNSKYVRIVTVLFAGTLFGTYVVYSQLARNPQAATSQQSQLRAVSGPSAATNAPVRNPGTVAPGSKSRAPLVTVQSRPTISRSNPVTLYPSAVMASSSKSIRVLDPKRSQELLSGPPGAGLNHPLIFTNHPVVTHRGMMEFTSKSAGPSLSSKASGLITNSPVWTSLFSSNDLKISR